MPVSKMYRYALLSNVHALKFAFKTQTPVPRRIWRMFDSEVHKLFIFSYTSTWFRRQIMIGKHFAPDSHIDETSSRLAKMSGAVYQKFYNVPVLKKQRTEKMKVVLAKSRL
jgi:hypothetical protein